MKRERKELLLSIWYIIRLAGWYSIRLAIAYDYVSDHIDEIAERILTLGYRPLVKLSDYAQNATLKEIDSKRYDVEESLNIVLKDFSELIGQLRNIIKLAQEYGDEGTADILIGSLKEFEKDSWMLRATLS